MHKEVRSRQRRLEAAVLGAAALFLAGAGGAAAAGNPDVTVIYLGSTSNWGSNGSGIRAYSVGTTSCNVVDRPTADIDIENCNVEWQLAGQIERYVDARCRSHNFASEFRQDVFQRERDEGFILNNEHPKSLQHRCFACFLQ